MGRGHRQPRRRNHQPDRPAPATAYECPDYQEAGVPMSPEASRAERLERRHPGAVPGEVAAGAEDPSRRRQRFRPAALGGAERAGGPHAVPARRRVPPHGGLPFVGEAATSATGGRLRPAAGRSRRGRPGLRAGTLLRCRAGGTGRGLRPAQPDAGGGARTRFRSPRSGWNSPSCWSRTTPRCSGNWRTPTGS